MALRRRQLYAASPISVNAIRGNHKRTELRVFVVSSFSRKWNLQSVRIRAMCLLDLENSA
jgi:hypothetical protein